MPLHPHAAAFIDQWNATGTKAHDLTPQQIRERRISELLPGESVYRVENRKIDGPAGEVPVRLYWPSDQRQLPILLWFHGGGWVLGDLNGADGLCRALANRVGAIVISVDYRMAPDFKFPSAVEDGYAAILWAAGNAAQIKGDRQRLAVGGSSAGGNLAAALSLMVRDRKGPLLCHQLLVYPVIDHQFERESYLSNAKGYCLTRQAMIWYWDQYVPDPTQRDHPYVSPLKAENLTQLPSAHVVTAEFDPLRDEGEAYANALTQVGIKVTCTRFNGQIHGFFSCLESNDDAMVAVEEASGRLKEDLA